MGFGGEKLGRGVDVMFWGACAARRGGAAGLRAGARDRAGKCEITVQRDG